MSGGWKLLRPPVCAPLRLFATEGIQAGNVPPDRQDVDVVGALAGVRGFEVEHVLRGPQQGKAYYPPMSLVPPWPNRRQFRQTIAMFILYCR